MRQGLRVYRERKCTAAYAAIYQLFLPDGQARALCSTAHAAMVFGIGTMVYRDRECNATHAALHQLFLRNSRVRAPFSALHTAKD